MIFKDNSPVGALEKESKQGEEILYVNYLNAPFVPSLADDPGVMASTIDALAENTSVSRVVFVQQRNYNYPFEQISLLAEIARVYTFLTKQESILSPERLSLISGMKDASSDLAYLLNLLKQDPVACYLGLKKRVRNARMQ